MSRKKLKKMLTLRRLKSKLVYKKGENIMNNTFTGVIPALMTASNNNDDTDFEKLKNHIEYLLNKGASGFYLTGSTGEGFLMEKQERKEVVNSVCSIVNKRVPVIVHTGSLSTKQAIELSESAKEAGADAISSVSPFYYGFHEEEIFSYYEDVATSTDLPFFVYDIPGTTNVTLSLTFLERLLSIKNVVGLKFTSMDIYKMERILKLPSKPIVFSGSDEMSFYGLWAGAQGLVGSSYNLLTDTISTMYASFKDQNFLEAHENYKLASEILNLLLNFPYFAAVKKCLEWDECDTGTPRKPFKSLTTKQEKDLRKGLKEVLLNNPQGETSLRKLL